MTPQWLMTGSLGRAMRFPTVGELYNTIQVGAIYQSANPNLKPEDVSSAELSAEYTTDKGKVRVSLFEEHVKDAIIAQTASYPGIAAPTSFTQNVDKTRQRGIELSFQQQDVLIRGLELTGSYTFVDAKILENSSYVPPTAMPWATSEGKRTPYIPIQRATLVGNYRPDDRWTYTLAGRFVGNVEVTGNLTVSGTTAFKIDDPRDPTKKSITHAAVETDELQVTYSGNVTTDATGRAVVKLPGYVEALGSDWRYQLTPIGSFSRAMVEKEIADGSFTVRSEDPNVRLSWQITGTRIDPYAAKNPLQVVTDKPAEDVGQYLDPKSYGASPSKQAGAELYDDGTSNRKLASEQPAGR